MPMRTSVQVYQEPQGTRWGVRVVSYEPTIEPLVFESPDEAIREGHRLAALIGAQLIVHDGSGRTEAKAGPTRSSS